MINAMSALCVPLQCLFRRRDLSVDIRLLRIQQLGVSTLLWPHGLKLLYDFNSDCEGSS